MKEAPRHPALVTSPSGGGIPALPRRGASARRGSLALGLVLLALVPPAGGGISLPGGAQLLSAQQAGGGDCRLMDTFGTLVQRQISPGNVVQYVTFADLRCPNGLRIRADSAVVWGQTGRNELIGRVRFTTSERDLRSDFADWYEQDGRLVARGNVVFGDLTEGTEVRGDNLNYLEARGAREEEVTVSGGRPSAVLPAETRPDGTAGEPFRVTANRLRFQGERFFWGDGEVELEREDLDARADSLIYDREAELLILNRDARVNRGEVSASGGNLNLTFEGDRLRRLVARQRGRIDTEEYTLTGLEVVIELGEDEAIEAVLAEGGEIPGTGERVVARIEGADVKLRGDRVEVTDGDDGQRILRATGGARAEARGQGFGAPGEEGAVDEPRAPAAADAADEGEEGFGPDGLPDRDWIEGEEILAFFDPVSPEEAGATDADPDAPGAATGAGAGSGEGAWRLVRLESTDNARALYRTEQDEAEEGAEEETPAPPATPPEGAGAEEPEDAAAPGPRWAITYILAQRIIIHLEDGAVSFLEAEGDVRGYQLEPRQGGAG